MKTIQKTVHLADLHFEHQQWLQELNFWKDELTTFRNRLAEVIGQWTDSNVMANVEHFQNQFILHDEAFDILRHDIREHEKSLSSHAAKHPVGTDQQHFVDHIEARDRMETRRHIYHDLKKEFFAFLTTTM